MKKHGHRHQCGGSQRKVWVVKGKWVKYIVMEGDLTLGGKHDVIHDIQMMCFKIKHLKPI